MKRDVVKTIRQGDQSWRDDYVPGTPQQRLALVWPLTREVAALCRQLNVERRLQRDVAVLDRRGR